MKKLLTITMLIAVGSLFGQVQAMQYSEAKDGSGRDYTIFVPTAQKQARDYGQKQWNKYQGTNCMKPGVELTDKDDRHEFFKCQRGVSIGCINACSKKYALPGKSQKFKVFVGKDKAFDKCCLGCILTQEASLIYPYKLK